jgi:hypothetical protein
MVSLDVGLENVRNAHVSLRRRVEVRLDVVLWIHHSAAGCARFSRAGNWRSRSWARGNAEKIRAHLPPLSYRPVSYRVQFIVVMELIGKAL